MLKLVYVSIVFEKSSIFVYCWILYINLGLYGLFLGSQKQKGTNEYK